MKQTSKKLQIILAVALFLCIAANIAGTVNVPEQAAPSVSVPGESVRG